ncbi:MAG: hypothetical protein WDO14_14315 [Bacteroidota bacterium]
MSVRSLIRNWLVPPGYLRIARSIIGEEKKIEKPGVFQLPGASANLETFRGGNKQQRCFILATGPSIKTQDLSRLKGENCIAVSWFHLHEHIEAIRPKWHVLAPLHPPFDDKTNQKQFDSLYTIYKDRNDIRFLLGHTDYFDHSYFNYLTKSDSRFSDRFKNETWFLNYSTPGQLDESTYMNESTWDIMKGPFELRTVIYPAIQLAYFLGFSEIILVGCDHDYLSDITRVENHHFYAENKGVSDKEHLSDFSMERWFYEYYMRWKQYRLMREFLSSRSVSIVNATNGGMLNVFQRVKFEEIV